MSEKQIEASRPMVSLGAAILVSQLSKKPIYVVDKDGNKTLLVHPYLEQHK